VAVLPRISDGVFQKDEHTRLGSLIGGIDEHRSLTKQSPMSLQSDVEHGFQERVARRDEFGEGLSSA